MSDSVKQGVEKFFRRSSGLLPIEPSFRVDLSLLDVANDARADPYGMDLRQRLRSGIWETACTTSSFMARSSPSTDEAAKVQGRVSRFLKTNDKYLACASMLLKSRAFHEVYHDKMLLELGKSPGRKRRRPVVELPRTGRNKPYIPLPKGWKNDTNRGCRTDDCRNTVQEEDVFSISVSHQFPFAGMAKILYDQAVCGESSKDNFAATSAVSGKVPPPIVGLDIVVFEKINDRLYSSEDEFLEVFRDQFASSEWKNGLQNPELGTPAMRMREFYVRWAMKEAYTKAIGVGMGLPFHSFEIHLDLHENIPSTQSIWNRIRKNKGGIPESFRGTIKFENENEEYFYFYFLPLVSSVPNSGLGESSIDGCAVVCVGSFEELCFADEKWRNYINISWTDMGRLLESHQNT